MAKLIGRNQRKATCKLCGIRYDADNGNMYATARTGSQENTGSFLCDDCVTKMESYCTKNNKVVGQLACTDSKKDFIYDAQTESFTFGGEFETSYSNGNARIELALMGFIPTADSTVDCEYKSPVQLGLQSLAKWVNTIDKLVADGDLSFADTAWYKVGTHFHVGHTTYINDNTMGIIRRFYNSLFIDLSNELANNPETTKALFGRNFNETEWANPITMNTPALNHTNFINLQHSKTIEFRLCKYQNGQQYLKAAHFCKDIVTIVINNFLMKYDENMTAESKRELARKAGAKMVKCFKKYTA